MSTSALRTLRASCFVLCWMFLACTARPQASVEHEPIPAGLGCTQHKDVYTCNWQAFQTVLPRMRSTSIETQPMDRYTAGQLRQLASAMGKAVATINSPADLTLSLTPIDPTGVDFGPGDRDLATLKIYAGNTITGNRTLLWVETYRGQADRPWPTVVHALIDQFQDRLKGSK